ncbi:endonuclease/exonuclease/phosphatase family protein [Catenovulum sediminis]|uniref:Endonuclease/exonuclease/phosphatase family protein n=1 Tax=Catenovulum sediminis TaxID=1740262 RepID=A0ABV1RJQ7_9ALTE
MITKKLLAGLCAFALIPVAQAATVFQEDFSIGLDGQFTPYSQASDKNWFNDTFNGTSTAAMNGHKGSTDSDDWFISPAIDLTQTTIDSATLTFKSRVRFDGMNLKVKASSDYVAGTDPSTATWTELTAVLPQDGQGSDGSDFVESGDISLDAYKGESVYLAFHYMTQADADGDNGAWYIDDVVVDVQGSNIDLPLVAAMTAQNTELKLAQDTEFKATAYSGAGAPYTFSWDFGDGTTATGAEVEHAYSSNGDFVVSLTVADANAVNSITLQQGVKVEEDVIVEDEPPTPYIVKSKMDDSHIRVASFNVSMEATNYPSDDNATPQSQILVDELAAGDNAQIQNIAEIIQRVRPDIVLLNEFDYIADENSGVQMFISQYLNIAQADDAQSIDYPYYFVAPSNTGEPTAFDLNNDGNFDSYMNDAFGFGRFPGHYGMVLLSRYPIVEEDVRTFQKFLWKDMPGNLMPVDPETGDNWYNEAETNAFRLSSKSHWDVPVSINGEIVHVLASHPTPPTFDGEEDRNGTRNHDEIRFWADYVAPAHSAYIYDDEGETGGLPTGARFVIAGDLNASIEGDAYPGTIDLLLRHPSIYNDFTPASEGGVANDSDNRLAAYHTASWQMRADYVLPSKSGLKVEQGNVFWPTEDQDLYPLVASRAASSDHRLVWLDLDVTETNEVAESDDDDDFVIEGGSANWLIIIAGFALAFVRQFKSKV